jgi:type VI secretion system secreted protein Hcp
MVSRRRFPRLLPWISSLAVAAAVGYTVAPSPASRPASHASANPALAALTQPMAATGANAIFLQVDGVTGDATNGADGGASTGWIQLNGYNWDASIPVTRGAPGSGGKPGVGNASLSDIQVAMVLSKATTQLFGALTSGKPVPTAKIQAVRTDGSGKSTSYLSITLSDVYVNHLAESASPDGLPAETMSLSYSKIAITYTAPVSKAGGINKYSACYDLASAQQCKAPPS